ncbi:MAG: pirin family protein, partial [Waterburya sp.]
KLGKLRPIIAPDERDGAIKIYQDAYLYVSVLKPGDKIDYEVQPNRYAWLQVAKGIVLLNEESLRAGDGVQISTPELLNLSTEVGTEVLLFDLA